MNDDGMMSPEAEDATRMEWMLALETLRKMRQQGLGPAKMIGALYEYGWACYQAGKKESHEARKSA